MFQSGFCYRDFCWAVSSVTTRQNKIPVKGNDGSHDLALIPLWDMCNHVEGEISTDYDPVAQQCVCYAAHSVAAGDEVCIYYGPRSNAELLLHSGFVYPNNRQDYLKIRLGITMYTLHMHTHTHTRAHTHTHTTHVHKQCIPLA